MIFIHSRIINGLLVDYLTMIQDTCLRLREASTAPFAIASSTLCGDSVFPLTTTVVVIVVVVVDCEDFEV